VPSATNSRSIATIRRLKLGLALGGGAAKGWAHIGVIRALAEAGFEPDIIAGSSVGSLVGAAVATGELDALEQWVRDLTRADVLKLLDARFRGGMIKGNRLMAAIESLLTDAPIEELGLPFGAVATDMELGREVWLQQGSVLAAVRASCALPLLFSPVQLGGRWLIDGGVVNPVPVSLCYAQGADVVIAVNLNPFHLERLRLIREKERRESESDADKSLMDQFKDAFGGLFDGGDEPGMLDVVSATIDIMQERITRSRLAGEPPQLEIHPHTDIQLMEFHRADEAIAAGRKAVEAAAAALGELRQSLGG
jgi:NTE family protein